MLIHGMTKTKLFYVWHNMKCRCNDKNNYRYYCYGGRGIKVCDEWIDNFLSFYNWSYKNGYAEGLQIDRIDNNNGYSPENCRWVDRFVNAQNKSSNILFTYMGETKCLKQWCRDLGVNYKVAHQRINRDKKSFIQAVNLC
jgi:hypothetical protein